MTHEEWGPIFGRIELAWGDISPHRRNYYFELLGDLDARAVRAAIDTLALEAREFVPPPGVIRDYAMKAAVDLPPPPPEPAPAPAVASPPPFQPVAARRESGKAVASLSPTAPSAP